MLLGIDLDGVVCDFDAAAQEWIQENFGYEPMPHTKWEWFLDYPDGKMVWRALWNKGVVDDGLFLKCPAIPGALEALDRLSQNHDIAFVTHRDHRHQDDTLQWLEWARLPFPVHFLENKALVGADIYLDDKPENVENIEEMGSEAWLFDQPWNQDAIHLNRMASWNDFEWYVNNPEFEDLSA